MAKGFQKGNKFGRGRTKCSESLTHQTRMISRWPVQKVLDEYDLMKKGKSKLRAIQMTAICEWVEAFKGNTTAIKEIRDRIEGKVPQAITGDKNNPVTIVLNEAQSKL